MFASVSWFPSSPIRFFRIRLFFVIGQIQNAHQSSWMEQHWGAWLLVPNRTVFLPVTSELHLIFIYTRKRLFRITSRPVKFKSERAGRRVTHKRTRYKSGGEKVEKPKLLIKTESDMFIFPMGSTKPACLISGGGADYEKWWRRAPVWDKARRMWTRANTGRQEWNVSHKQGRLNFNLVSPMERRRRRHLKSALLFPFPGVFWKRASAVLWGTIYFHQTSGIMKSRAHELNVAGDTQNSSMHHPTASAVFFFFLKPQLIKENVKRFARLLIGAAETSENFVSSKDSFLRSDRVFVFFSFFSLKTKVDIFREALPSVKCHRCQLRRHFISPHLAL